jgi:hypothetical protein
MPEGSTLLASAGTDQAIIIRDRAPLIDSLPPAASALPIVNLPFARTGQATCLN